MLKFFWIVDVGTSPLPSRPRLFISMIDAATTEFYTLSLHDALPICLATLSGGISTMAYWRMPTALQRSSTQIDRKSTRLNSSHMSISYAVFCLKKKKSAHVKVVRTLPRHELRSSVAFLFLVFIHLLG